MKVADVLAARRENWHLLEQMCLQMEKRRKQPAWVISRFAALYRAACADLALADAYQLPPNTVFYLHQLVGRAHNQLYRARKFKVAEWGREMFVEVPRRLYRDNALRLSFIVFWGIFLGSLLLARENSQYASDLLGPGQMASLQDSFSQPIDGRDPDQSSAMVGFYIWHNTGIGLQCFSLGLLFGVGGLFAIVFNAASLGAAFGYMCTVAERTNFYHFVTAHGPFELTAIVLSGAAGMRLGFSLIDTKGKSRRAALQLAGREAMPTMGAAIALFAMAGVIEAFLSPSSAPYAFKAAAAIFSTLLLLGYFFGLGRQRGDSVAT